MGIDLDHRHLRKSRRVATRSNDPYLNLLVKVYRFLARRTKSRFNEIVLKRLFMSRSNRGPLSLLRLIRNYKAALRVRAKESSTDTKKVFKAPSRPVVAVVGTVTDDHRLYHVPEGLRICALRVTASARARIIKAKGEVLTFDQLAYACPTGSNCLLLRGPMKSRKVYKHFGLAPGQKGSKSKPYSISHGPKFDRNRRKRRVHGLRK
ncbi:hypothetical protein ACOME3_003560 [Neoechinorhynchus agilis]